MTSLFSKTGKKVLHNAKIDHEAAAEADEAEVDQDQTGATERTSTESQETHAPHTR